MLQSQAFKSKYFQDLLPTEKKSEREAVLSQEKLVVSLDDQNGIERVMKTTKSNYLICAEVVDIFKLFLRCYRSRRIRNRKLLVEEKSALMGELDDRLKRKEELLRIGCHHYYILAL